MVDITKSIRVSNAKGYDTQCIKGRITLTFEDKCPKRKSPYVV